MAIRATNATSATSAKKQVSLADFAGTWQIDPSKSEGMRGGMRGDGMRGDGMRGDGMRGGGMRGGGMRGGGGEAGMRGERPEGGPRGGGPGGGRRMLPRFLRITASDQGLALADSSGTMVQEIVLGAAATDGQDKEPPQLSGVLKGDHLIVTRTTERGTMTETFDLEKGGEKLEVTTKMAREGGEGREMQRTYNRIRS
jgi:pentapeptide MXKDX repeat protein